MQLDTKYICVCDQSYNIIKSQIVLFYPLLNINFGFLNVQSCLYIHITIFINKYSHVRLFLYCLTFYSQIDQILINNEFFFLNDL